jgi:hypothetical protein
MTAIHLGDVVPVLDAPEPTATKLGRRFGRQIDWAKIAETASEPSPAEDAPLSKRQAARSVETAHAPKWRGGTFRCPLGMRGPTFNAHCTDHVRRWIEEERRQGFDIWSGTRIQIDPGPYPATDLATGLKLLGEREMLVRAQFVEREPEAVRLELPGGLFAPWRPTPLRLSSGDE